MKKPVLKLIRPGRKPAATGLGPDGKKFFDQVQAEFGITDIGGLGLLQQACRALDRAESCRAQIAREGQTLITKIGPKEHPLIKAENAARSLFIRAVKELGISLEPKKTMGRPTASSYHQKWQDQEGA